MRARVDAAAAVAARPAVGGFDALFNSVLLLASLLLFGGLRVDLLGLDGIVLDALFQGGHLRSQSAVFLERAGDRLLEVLGA